MSVVAVVAEVKAAQAFLRAVGASPTNTDLIYAVISWFRQESGSLKNVIGNNPFNIRPGMTSFMASGERVSTRGNGRFLIFPTLSAGFAAAAYLLLHGHSSYALVVRALRNGSALDFITAISLSAWDASHYGYHDADVTTSHIYRIYASFTGLQMPKPAPTQPKKVAQKKLMPIRPRDLNAPVIVRDYIDPHETRRMYAARHREDNVLPGLEG